MDLTAPMIGSLQLWHLLLLCAIPLFFVLSFNMLLGGRTATASHILVADKSLANELKQQVELSLCCLYCGLCLCGVSVRSLTQCGASLCSALSYCVICYSIFLPCCLPVLSDRQRSF